MEFGSNPNLYRGVFLLFVFLLSMVLLFSSLCVSVFDGNISSFVSEVPDQVVVNTEAELINAVDNAVGSTVIALNGDITLLWSLVISGNKNITLTSNRATGFYKLIGPNDQSTIGISAGGVLTIDGIIVTHETGDGGSGVAVGGALIMVDGEISGNYANRVGNGGGVTNYGVFTMLGGTISNNTAHSGGGVLSGFDCFFVMSGGKISDNSAEFGGGVHMMSGSFVMEGGEIISNAASRGGGVYLYAGNIRNVDPIYDGSFVMSGGKISGNTAEQGGGVYNRDVTFKLSGGIVFGNAASKGSGDVYNDVGVVYYFGVRAVVVICVSVVLVVVGVIVFVGFFYSKKQKRGLQ